MTTGSSSGTAPPARPVPEPRATNGRPWRRAARTHACTSAVVIGKHTTAAAPVDVRGVALVAARARAARCAPDRRTGRRAARRAGRPGRRASRPHGRGHGGASHGRDGSAVVWRAMAADRCPTTSTSGSRSRIPTRTAPGSSTSRSCCPAGRASTARAARACSPGRHPSWPRAAAATAPTSSTTTTSPRSRAPPPASPTTSGSYRAKGREGGWITTDTDGHPRHPPRRRRVHLPQPPRLPAGARLRAAPGGAGRRASVRWTGSPTCAGSSRCASRSTPTSTATSPPRCGSGSGATGARAATSSTGGAPTRPTPSSATTPCLPHHARRDRRAGRRARLRSWPRRCSPTAPSTEAHACSPTPPSARSAGRRRTLSAARSARRRSGSVSSRLRMRTAVGVTSTSSSSAMNSIAVSSV